MHSQQNRLGDIRNEHHQPQTANDGEYDQGYAAGKSEDVMQHYVPAPGMKRELMWDWLDAQVKPEK